MEKGKTPLLTRKLSNEKGIRNIKEPWSRAEVNASGRTQTNDKIGRQIFKGKQNICRVSKYILLVP